MSLDKTRRGRLCGAALFGVMAVFEAGISRHAQLNHTVVPYKASWFTPEVGYFAAVCFLLMSAFLLVSAFRRSDEQK
jgi:hypothetical protein